MANPSIKIIPILHEHMLSIAIWKSWSHHSKHKVHLYLLVWHFQTVWSFNNWTCIQAISRHLWQIWLLLLTTYRCTALWFMINNLIQKFKIKNPNTFYNNRVMSKDFTYRKVASSRPVYYSILQLFDQRSQYIQVKYPLHKPSENVLLTETGYFSRLYGM